MNPNVIEYGYVGLAYDAETAELYALRADGAIYVISWEAGELRSPFLLVKLPQEPEEKN